MKTAWRWIPLQIIFLFPLGLFSQMPIQKPLTPPLPQTVSVVKPIQIIELGHAVLRQKAKPVGFPLSLPIQKLIQDMLTALKATKGVGIAAPQINAPLRIFLIRPPSAPGQKALEVIVAINPEILSQAKDTIQAWEGCLSVPGIRGYIRRFAWIKIRYFSEAGKKIERRYDGFTARIFQHENDHLDGLIWLDRLKSLKDIVTESYYQQQIRPRVTQGK